MTEINDESNAFQELGLPVERKFFKGAPPRPVDTAQLRALYRGELPEELAEEVRELTLCFREWAEADERLLAESAQSHSGMRDWREVTQVSAEDIAIALSECVQGAELASASNRELAERAKALLIKTPIEDINAEAWLYEALADGVERLLLAEAQSQKSIRANSRTPPEETAHFTTSQTTLATARSHPVSVEERLRALGDLDQIDPRQALIYRLHFFAGRSANEIGKLLQLDDALIREEIEIAAVEISVAASTEDGA